MVVATWVAVIVVIVAWAATAAAAPSTPGDTPSSWPSAYNVVWTERADWSSAGALGSMPLGSGRTGLNLWADDGGLRLLFSATDSYDEWNMLLKLGQVNIDLSPNPFAPLPPAPAPPAPPPGPRPTGLSGFTEEPHAIGCANAGCTDPSDPNLLRDFNCKAVATCPAESAAACAAWAACKMFSINPVWGAGKVAQMFSACPSKSSLRGGQGKWNSWYLNASASGGTCTPPFDPPKVYHPFRQELDLERGLVTVRSGAVLAEIFVDWNADVARVRVSSTDGSKLTGSVSTYLWRNQTTPVCADATHCMPVDMCPAPTNETTFAPDTIDHNASDTLWYRRNPSRTSVDASLEQQLLPSVVEGSRDNLGNNTFGMLVSAGELSPTSAFEVTMVAHVNQTESVEAWREQIHAKSTRARSVSHVDARDAHAAAWKSRWARSWFHTDAPPGTEQYNNSMTVALGRYVNLCQGRGDTPTHFTGGIFTTFQYDSYSNFNYDYRSWGTAYWWQNTRFAYDPMLADGDYDIMVPLFEFYALQLPTSQELVKRYYKHAGAKFYETAHPQGTAVMDQWGCADTPGGVHNKTPCNQGQPNPAATMQELRTICRPHDLYEKGCTRLNTTVSDCDAQNPFIRHHFSASIEVPLMMLRHWLHTYNESAAQRWLVPVATQTMTFFDQHWQGSEFFMQNAQALESYSFCDQPACDMAGLRQLLRGLLLPEVGPKLFSVEQQALFHRLQAKVNATQLPVFTNISAERHSEPFVNQSQLPLLAPCARGGDSSAGYQPGVWEQQNREPIAMYAVWPFELFGVNRSSMLDLLPSSIDVRSPEAALALARDSYKLQPYPGRPEGYNMISVFSANLGLVNTTRDLLNYKWGTGVKSGPNDYSSNRFPVWWGPSNSGGEVCDDPGCNEIADEARIALQHMLLQSDNHGERLLLFPAWPKNWDIEFKLHAERNTSVAGKLKGGKLVGLTVTPPERAKDVVVLLK